MLFFVSKSHNISIYELPTHLRARFREVGASLLVSTHYWVLTGMSTMPPSGRSKKLVPEFLEGIIHDQNVRHQPLSSPRSRMGNFAATVKRLRSWGHRPSITKACQLLWCNESKRESSCAKRAFNDFFSLLSATSPSRLRKAKATARAKATAKATAKALWP